MDAAYNPALWSALFSALVGASAALTGLMFVAISLHAKLIVAEKQRMARAAKAQVALTGVLLVSILCLVPHQNITALGTELTLLGGMAWIAATGTQRAAMHGSPHLTRRQRLLQSILTQLSAIPFLAAGLSLLFVWGGGLYWLVAGTVFAFIASLSDGWVLLIEICRDH